MTDNACREAFEKWLDNDASATRTARSKYYTAQEQVLGWLAWQAASSQSAELVREMRDALDAFSDKNAWQTSDCKWIIRNQDRSMKKAKEALSRANAFLEGRHTVSEDDVVEIMRKAMVGSRARSDEGEFPLFIDIIDMSENNMRIVTTEAARAAYRALLAAQGKGDGK